MAESTYPTIGHGQVNVYVFPVKAHGATWVGAANIAAMFGYGQVDRVQTVGIGAFDLSLRERYEVGRTAAMQKVPASSIDKPATIETLENGTMRLWNLLAGKEPDNTADINYDDFDATTSEFVLLVHKLDENKTNVIESDIITRCVVDSWGLSVPSSRDDDLRRSIRITGESQWHCAGPAGKVVGEICTAAGSVVTVEAAYAGAVERDDWDDADDGTAVRTVMDGALSGNTIPVNSTTGFGVGQDILIWNGANSWETARISSISAGVSLTLQDTPTTSPAAGSQVKRTRGFFFVVHNSDSNDYLILGEDYRVVKTDASTLTIVNVDGGSDIGATDDVWCFWAVASGGELWTANDTDAYGVEHTKCKFVVSPEATFESGTVGYTDTGNTEDTDLDFEDSGGNVDTEWYGREFTTVRAGKVKSVTLVMKKTGTPAGKMWAEIWTDDGEATSLPDAITGNPSDPLICDTALASGGGSVTFTFTDGPTLSNATAYWVAIKTAAYAYTDTTTEVIWQVDADGTTGGDEVAKCDTSTGTWTIVNTNYGADLTVTMEGSQEIKRIQGMDLSCTFSTDAQEEMGNTESIERTFEEAEVRATVPMLASDVTTWALVTQKNPASVRTIRPEQNPEAYARLQIYSSDNRLDSEILMCYELPQVQRGGGEKSASANERMTKRVTLETDQFTIASAL